MGKFLLITGLLITSICEAQETLFKIISVKGVVTLDGDTVNCGQRATSVNLVLHVKGKTDYAIILTEKGFVFRLDAGKYTVTELFRRDYHGFINGTGSVDRHDFNPLRIVATYNWNSFLFSDSVTVIVRPAKNKINQYRLVIVSQYNEELYDSISASHVHTVKVLNLFSQEHLVVFHMEAENKKITSREYAVKELQPNDKIKISYDFDCIHEDDFISQKLSILAVCEVHSLYFDQVNHLYRLWKYSQNTGVKITHPYYQRLVQLYDLDKFLPAPLTGD